MTGKETSVTMLTDRRIRVSVSRQVDYAKAKITLFCDGDLPDGADMVDASESICEELEQLAEDRITIYEEGYEETPEEETPEEPVEEEVEEEEVEEEEVEEEEVVGEKEEDGTEEGEELDLSEADVNAMTKSELIELCKTVEGLEEVDTKMNLRPLRATLIDLLFEEDEEGEEEDRTDPEEGDTELNEDGTNWEQDDWQD